ncbi:hypothetical protein FBU30_002468 [Linnemannia zychae]|nr:hypothetical protein FBU30_002468 [Linnemannia zychae]
MAFMRGGNYLYVQGGKSVNNNVQISISTQLAALDLSKSWSTVSPVWKILAPGPAYNLYNGVSTPDNQTLITFFNGQQFFINIYSVESNSWQYTSVIPSGELLQAIRTVIDPNTSLVYINGARNMNIYNPSSRQLTQLPIPQQVLTARFFVGAVYHPTRRSIMYMGGVTGALVYEPTTYITEFTIDSQTWGTFPTIGDLPTPRSDHCMAISEDGNTIVMFGGRTPPPGNFTGTFYILDVPSKTWTQGPTASIRLYSACSIVGDQFVVWGGFDGASTIDGPPIIYSFSQKQWIEQYTPPAYFASMPTPSSSNGSPGSPQNSNSSNSGSSSPSNLGGILGGVLGSLCVVALAGVVYLYLKRRGDRAMYEEQAQKRIIQQAEQTNEAPSSSNNNSTSGVNGNESTNGQIMKPENTGILPSHVNTTRNPQITATPIDGNIQGRSPQDATAMGFNFELFNRQDPQLLPVSPLNTPMGDQQYTSSIYNPSTTGITAPTIFNPSTVNSTGPGVVGYTTIPVQTTTGIAFMPVPVQSSSPYPTGITSSNGGFGFSSVPLQVPIQPFQNSGEQAYASVPLQSPTAGGYYQPTGSLTGTPTMGYAGFSPVQSSQDNSPGSTHQPLVASNNHSDEQYYPPPPHPAVSGS